ncbi:hypothetical protein SAMN05216480_11918 [Pustulibacterium marinum]|uniref:Uncharacterized protein n=1 Tax=Pustulibacterium marinum TaxID=1224947 RepID=A0A1I7IPW3_9FLAO|nr:hypothetical protein [Pustulibacterium marinum]SFU74979.1 hypothetical protein SAMN05216480_11918 [Pustulibacterium marinum]
MKNISILYIGKDKDILETMLRVINKNPDWKGTGESSIEKAKKQLVDNRFSIILLGNGLSTDEEKEIENYVLEQELSIPVIQHYGGGSGLLQSEIFTALNQKKS